MQNTRNINSYLPQAMVIIKGSEKYNKINGKAYLYSFKNGTIFKVEIEGLPNVNKNNFFGFHIHEGPECGSGKEEKPFEIAGDHLNLENDKHPNHIGDLPMIYSNGGYAYMEFFTSRFKPSDVINHVLMIHENMDDLMTDPAGNSGERIACGKIVKYK